MQTQHIATIAKQKNKKKTTEKSTENVRVRDAELWWFIFVSMKQTILQSLFMQM